MSPTIFQLSAALLVLAALSAWANARYLRLPGNTALLALGLLVSLGLVTVAQLRPDLAFPNDIREAVGSISFDKTLMDGMLGFLLFAGALHVDWHALKERSLSVGLMATVGVIVSVALCGTGFWFLCAWLGVSMPLFWALVFGALISPTDPVAVLATLKSMRGVPSSLEVDMAGESLFNDGVGVVVFTILLSAATSSGGVDLAAAGELFVVEAVGGAVFGAATGWVAYRMMLAIDDYPIEVLISLALVTGTYASAHALHLSGPIAVVVAGLLIGERGVTYAMSDRTQRYVHGFWTLIDEVLNTVLFLLIGLEFLVIELDFAHIGLALLAVPLVLGSRLVAVVLPFQIVRLKESFPHGVLAILTWGGIRGGISIALALSMDPGPTRDLILTATYAVVLFSVLVQSLTLQPLVARVFPPGEGQSKG